MAARERGMGYSQLIGRILESAAARYHLPKKPAAPALEPVKAIEPPLPQVDRGTGT